jgi:hypothetical protein
MFDLRLRELPSCTKRRTEQLDEKRITLLVESALPMCTNVSVEKELPNRQNAPLNETALPICVQS